MTEDQLLKGHTLSQKLYSLKGHQKILSKIIYEDIDKIDCITEFKLTLGPVVILDFCSKDTVEKLLDVMMNDYDVELSKLQEEFDNL